MIVKVNRNSFVYRDAAKEFFTQNGISCNCLTTFCSNELELSCEQCLEGPTQLIPSFIFDSFFEQGRNLEEFLNSSRDVKIKTLILLIKEQYYITKTEARSYLSILINWIKTENIQFTAEEAEEIGKISGVLNKLNTIFNSRKTYIKVFCNAFTVKVFSVNMDSYIVFNREYAIDNGICPDCGSKLLFSEDNHYDHNNQRRLYCENVCCNNSFFKCVDLDHFGLEALEPVYDKNSLFPDETLVQSMITLTFVPNTHLFLEQRVVKEVLYFLTHQYNKGCLKKMEDDVAIFVTQPMGLKTMKKLIERIETASVMGNGNLQPITDFVSINSKIIRLFNVSNIERIYKVSLEKEGISFPNRTGVIFDLIRMEVTEIPEEKQLTDAFEATENGYIFKANDHKLLDILLEEEK